MLDRSDETLLREYRAGSEDAFRTLAQQYGGLVYGACLKSLRRPEPAEDAAQAVFLVLARKAGKIHIRTTLVPWLLTTSRMVCRNVMREERRRMRHEVPLHEEIASSEAQQDHSIFEALERLREPEREAIVLRFVQGLSLDEVGKAQGVSEDAARMRIQRAIGRLRKSIVPNLSIAPSLLNRLSNPEAASAAIQQIARRSMTAFTPIAVSALVLVAMSGGAVIASLSARHPSPPKATITPAVTRAPQDVLSSKPVAAAHTVPTLNGPFTLEYKFTSYLPNETTAYLTLSSNGRTFVAIHRNEEHGDPDLIFLTDGGRYYALMTGQGANMWVTRTLSLQPTMPFSGVNFPVLPAWSKNDFGAGPDHDSGTFRLTGWDDEKGAVYQIAHLDFDPKTGRVNSVALNRHETWKKPETDGWRLGDYQLFNGVPIARTSVNTTFDYNSGQMSGKEKFELLSATAEALPDGDFLPEHYLYDGNNVEFKIPMQAGMKLDFQFHPGKTIEQQARDQDQLEMKIHHITAQP